MAHVRPWEHYRFDALLQAARISIFGEDYSQNPGYQAYQEFKSYRLPLVIEPFFFEE